MAVVFLPWLVFAQRFGCTIVQTVQISFYNTKLGTVEKTSDMHLVEFHINKLHFIVLLHLDLLSFVFCREQFVFFVQNFMLFVQQKRLFVQPLCFLRDWDLNIQ